MLAEVVSVPEWILGVVGALVSAGIIGTIASYALIIARLTRIETKLENGDGRFRDVEARQDKHSARIRDLERAEDRRQGVSGRHGSEGSLKPRQL
jgi:hypothetical protein